MIVWKIWPWAQLPAVTYILSKALNPKLLQGDKPSKSLWIQSSSKSVYNISVKSKLWQSCKKSSMGLLTALKLLHQQSFFVKKCFTRLNSDTVLLSDLFWGTLKSPWSWLDSSHFPCQSIVMSVTHTHRHSVSSLDVLMQQKGFKKVWALWSTPLSSTHNIPSDMLAVENKTELNKLITFVLLMDIHVCPCQLTGRGYAGAIKPSTLHCVALIYKFIWVLNPLSPHGVDAINQSVAAIIFGSIAKYARLTKHPSPPRGLSWLQRLGSSLLSYFKY